MKYKRSRKAFKASCALALSGVLMFGFGCGGTGKASKRMIVGDCYSSFYDCGHGSGDGSGCTG